MSIISNIEYMEQIYMFILIGFTYAFLLSLIVDKILDYNNIEEKCNKINTQNHTTCIKLYENYDINKFIIMFCLGISSILVGICLSYKDDAFTIDGFGIIFGGFILSGYYTILNWYKLNQYLKIVILAFILITLFYYSTKIFNLK